jgi:hypothetical protein
MSLTNFDTRMEFLEDTSLPTGKIMYYRACRDIHVQAPPSAFSMSLNLMIVSADFGARDQYWFDLSEGRVTGHVQTPAASQLLMCHLARWFGADSTLDTLDQLSERAVNPRVRLAALDSSAILRPDDLEQLARRAGDDPSPLVQQFGQQGSLASAEPATSAFKPDEHKRSGPHPSDREPSVCDKRAKDLK